MARTLLGMRKHLVNLRLRDRTYYQKFDEKNNTVTIWRRHSLRSFHNFMVNDKIGTFRIKSKTMQVLILIELWYQDKHVGYERLTKEKGWEWNYFDLDPDSGRRWISGTVDNSNYKRVIVQTEAKSKFNLFIGEKIKNSPSVSAISAYVIAKDFVNKHFV